jgi:hypothetical protein
MTLSKSQIQVSGKRSWRAANIALVALVAAGSLLLGAGTASAATSFQTGLYDPMASAGGPGLKYAYLQPELAFKKARAAGATRTRLLLYWSRIARSRPTNPADPNDPAYFWHDPGYNFDAQVSTALSHGLQPFVTVLSAPPFAECDNRGDVPHQCPERSGYNEGTYRPDAEQLAFFMEAAARRYPQVRAWGVWNEPNAVFFLSPTEDAAGNHISVARYRDMVNLAATKLHAIDSRLLVQAGGPSPFGRSDSQGVETTIPPLTFMRELLSQPIRFDIWSNNPYTAGGPSHSAYRANDVSIGDLPDARRVLRAAIANNRIISTRKVAFWVTEFSWDSKPPDPCGVPSALHTRWVSEAPYRMWRAGVSVLMWTQLKDYPFVRGEIPYQGGLYSWGGNGRVGAPKGAMRAFRFPFVALKRSGGAYVWGRTPWGKAGRVKIQKKTSRGWATVKTVRTNRNGIFQGRFFFSTSSSGRMRARRAGSSLSSVGFSLKPTKSQIIQPLGC